MYILYHSYYLLKKIERKRLLSSLLAKQANENENDREKCLCSVYAFGALEKVEKLPQEFSIFVFRNRFIDVCLWKL